MARKGNARVRALTDLVRQLRPDLDATEAIRSGLVRVNGLVAVNPGSRVRGDASIAVRPPDPRLRGELKLGAALRLFDVPMTGSVALDLGAAAGGFTRALLLAGAARVYAVEAGHGQLRGTLRQDRRVVNLERTNLGRLDRALVPDQIDVVAADLSYVALAKAIPQLNERVSISHRAELVCLVKPQFELGLREPPTQPRALEEAVRRASVGIERAGWKIVASSASPVRGSRGAIEYLLHGRRQP